MSTSETAPAPTERSVRILEAACTVIVRDGAHGLRMASVAREAQRLEGARALLLRDAAGAAPEARSQFSEQRWHAALDEQLAALPTAAAKLERMLLAGIEPDLPFSEQRALGNEIWSSLRSDDELRPLVERSYRAWLARVVGLIDDGRADGSIPGRGRGGGGRLAARGGGGRARLAPLSRPRRPRAGGELMRGAIALELGTA